ncbi:MAG: 2Fe-2S iron-sulfur cluster binding domain-containing protein, partial [Pseudomonadota bacterium]
MSLHEGRRLAAAQVETCNVQVTDREGVSREFLADLDERLLHSGLAAAVGLPHECGTGTCGMCKATLVTGDIDDLWGDAPGKKACRRRGEVLLCQSSARSDVTFQLKSAFTAPTEPSCDWRPGQLQLWRRLTSDVALFRCHLDAPIAYDAGQFALVEIDGLAGPRAWSMIAFAPDRPFLDFLVRRAPGGGASELLFSGATIAQPVRIFGPLGKATWRPEEDRPFVAIAGGSGIAGMLAIIDRLWQADTRPTEPSQVFF